MPDTSSPVPAELNRLAQDAQREVYWKRWGPYLADRQWGTVREDYSAKGEAWSYFPHDHAAARAYRWGEDGLLGLCDAKGRLCFGVSLWNGRDPILKERLFGLTGDEGNHGEDVKEVYHHLASTPTHSWMEALYKYPQSEYPYARLVAESRARDRTQPEFELVDTGAFDDDRYFDVFIRYAKAGPNDILIEIEVVNRGPDAARIHILPTWWYRNSWVWGCAHEGCELKPRLHATGPGHAQGEQESLGSWRFAVEDDSLPWYFTENETNRERVFNTPNDSPFTKDAFHRRVIHGETSAVNPQQRGTKCAAHADVTIEPGSSHTVRARFCAEADAPPDDAFFGSAFTEVFNARRAEAEVFFDNLPDQPADPEARSIVRQAYAGLLWTKQFYHYIVDDWLKGDPYQPPPPPERRAVRNGDWKHLYNRAVLSMPDKWEYPWFAAWDLAFHMIPLAHIDPDFAKEQLKLLLREWYMHPNGQMPAYEWNFSDVNPPVHAWACWRVYKMTGPRGERDELFLARTFQKLLVNFTWWVNRKDPQGNNLFAGGFLGLDNIGVFDRSKELPIGGSLAQADGTAWMAFYCSTMLAMALQLAETRPEYEDIASKFFEHFVSIVDAMNELGGDGLWHEEDGFYYDQYLPPDGPPQPLRVRSMVGIIPLFAVEFMDDARLDCLPGFAKRTRWFLKNRPDLARQITYFEADGKESGHHLLAIPSRERLERVLRYVFDEEEFLSPHGIRSLSKAHQEHPFVMQTGKETHSVNYVPGESDSFMFGGNSNWRGPIWFPLNYLLIEALERYHHFYGDSFTMEYPTGSGTRLTLDKIADDIAKRLGGLFLPDPETGRRPAHGEDERYASDPHWRQHVLFYEYFHGDTGQGLGASHQTGWTALVARLLEKHQA
ncbi:MGH1-like glycoside hydrolase domain-containing protein [Synoicihabitans lomoniglobus]|uniref:Mannosylglycerate hydrolase MGH1-like glycoside hydrolase domain-containing protein n=1 Tax=Synoicihabitans lomoniglobus TaxID=2909285 RepID=A0AAE9ZYK6_9BACT|nr:hypothetical protein [Opitutaceae bacterium LMO-M01]WED65440.1 hypothetical protein PXH66_01075 [Opitutaceae bacterium LMO-M01]